MAHLETVKDITMFLSLNKYDGIFVDGSLENPIIGYKRGTGNGLWESYEALENGWVHKEKRKCCYRQLEFVHDSDYCKECGTGLGKKDTWTIDSEETLKEETISELVKKLEEDIDTPFTGKNHEEKGYIEKLTNWIKGLYFKFLYE
ncbi:hypothetical protein GOV06_00975 [Candidatus Woesearchaeota archaeon]|nr:hypothetical protein [Candidatus Woesearchaeota archaeon]